MKLCKFPLFIDDSEIRVHNISLHPRLFFCCVYPNIHTYLDGAYQASIFRSKLKFTIFPTQYRLNVERLKRDLNETDN